MIIGLAAVAAAIGAWLSWPVRSPIERLQQVRLPARGRSRLLLFGLPAVLLLLAIAVAGDGLGRLLQLASVGVVIVTVIMVLRTRARERQAEAYRSDIAEAAQVLAQTLQTGAVPAVALQEAAAECPVLQPAAAAQRIGGDPVGVLFASSILPGGGGLAELARAWALIERSGVPAADLLSRLADTAADESQLAAELRTELAASRFTGRLLAGLPLVGLAVGFVVGGDPLGFLLHDLWGQLCLFLGIALAGIGVLWSERMAELGETRSEIPVEWS